MTAPHDDLSEVGDLAALARIAQQDAGLHLPPTKYPMMRTRLRKRLAAVGLDSLKAYRALIENNGRQGERARMISALTTHVSHFFREPHHFDMLRSTVLPPLVARARNGGQVRLWSAGCARGQEAYSIALTLLDVMPDAPRRDIRLLATDLDPGSIALAEQGRFSTDELARIPGGALHRFLPGPLLGQAVAPDLRSLIRFQTQNLHEPWPARLKFDVIFCRNVLIYFDQKGCETLLSRFAAALNPGGWLFLGHAERLSGLATQHFVRAGQTCFRRVPDPWRCDGTVPT